MTNRLSQAQPVPFIRERIPSPRTTPLRLSNPRTCPHAAAQADRSSLCLVNEPLGAATSNLHLLISVKSAWPRFSALLPRSGCLVDLLPAHANIELTAAAGDPPERVGLQHTPQACP